MIAGDPYIGDDPVNAERNKLVTRLVHEYHMAVIADRPDAREILEQIIGDLGDDVVIRPPLNVDYGEFISIGARTFINFNFTALDVSPIRIGEDCQIGPNVQLLPPTHPVEPQPRRDKIESGKPITIGDNVWLGGGAIVCPGVTIGENSVIGAGAVVTKDIPANVVAVGNPARVIKEI